MPRSRLRMISALGGAIRAMCHVLIGTRRRGNFAHNICPSRRAFLETLSGYRFLTFDLHLHLWDRCWGGDTCHLSPFCPSLYIEGGKIHLLHFVFTELYTGNFRRTPTTSRRFPATARLNLFFTKLNLFFTKYFTDLSRLVFAFLSCFCYPLVIFLFVSGRPPSTR